MPELLDSASLIKEMTISLDPYPWEPNFDESVKVNIWCTNGAALIDECHSHRGMPEFRVDTTPPQVKAQVSSSNPAARTRDGGQLARAGDRGAAMATRRAAAILRGGEGVKIRVS